MHKQHKVTDYLLLSLFGIFLFIPFLGLSPLFDWDEINFAEAAREMIMSGDYARVQINFRPFWEKPPLFIWMQAASMHLFGINEFAARLPNAICGIITLNLMYFFGVQIKSRSFGWFWALLIAGSVLPHFYFQSGIIDPWFNLFIWLSILFGYMGLTQNKSLILNFSLAGFSLGLAVLVKGPVAFIIAALSFGIFVLFNKPKRQHIIPILYGILLFIVTASSWFIVDMLQHGTWFTFTFIDYQIRLFKTEDAGHGGPFFYHFLVVLLGCFPASFFALGLLRKKVEVSAKSFTILSVITVLVVLVLFSIVKTKIVHYSSMTYLPLCGLGALYLESKSYNKRAIFLIIGAFLILLSCTLISLPFIGMHPSFLSVFLSNDPFAMQALDAQVFWSYYDFIPGILMFVLSVFYILRMNKSESRFMYIFLAANAILLSVAIIIFTPKIEKYSQGAFIEFCKKQGKSGIIDVYGFKSYAHYFYGSREMQNSPLNYNEAMDSTWEKPVYVVSKYRRKGALPDDGRLMELYRKNGYVFYKKK